MIDSDFAELYLASQIVWEAEPELSTDEKESLVEAARAIDVNGISPGGTGYIETYTYDSMHSAIHLGWTWKLAKAVELFHDDEDEIFEHCKKMVEFWAGRIATSSVGVGGTSASDAGSLSIANVGVW